jgi:hypothetical protein
VNIKKTNKKITIEEFKMWLEGLEAFQSQNWAPNLEQWKMIKSKIFSLSGSKTLAAQEQRPVVAINGPRFTQQPSPQQQTQRLHPQPKTPVQNNPALIPIDEDIGDSDLIKLPPPRIPPGAK